MHSACNIPHLGIGLCIRVIKTEIKVFSAITFTIELNRKCPRLIKIPIQTLIQIQTDKQEVKKKHFWLLHRLCKYLQNIRKRIDNIKVLC